VKISRRKRSELAKTGYDVFLSYSHTDSDFVCKLDVALQANGLRVFLDKRDIRYGDLIVDSVFAAIADAKAQLVIISGTPYAPLGCVTRSRPAVRARSNPASALSRWSSTMLKSRQLLRT
jgi:hypothetical protein